MKYNFDHMMMHEPERTDDCRIGLFGLSFCCCIN